MPDPRQQRIERARMELRALSDRENAVSRVHEYYAKFGEQVVRQVLRFATRSDGLRELIVRLPSEYTANNEAQAHSAILRFLHEHGAARFLALFQNEKAPAEGNPRAADAAQSAVPVSTVKPSKSGKAGTPSRSTREEPDPQAPPPHEDAFWVYVNRRSGVERRSGRDRRSEVDTVFKNLRFGGERRGGADRRKTQIPPPWPKTPPDES